MGLFESEPRPVGLEPTLAEDELPDIAPKQTMTQGEALEKLLRGETIHNVRIERLHLRGEFHQPVRLRNVVLVHANFEGATFHKEVVLSRCVLDRPHFARKNVFAEGLTLSESTLTKVHLSDVTVRGPLLCSDTQFRGKLQVSRSTFEGRVSFWDARFRGWVEFKDCVFRAEADFRSFHAEEGFVLSRCHFTQDVLFRGATVEKKFDAKGSRFEKLLDFSKAKLHDFVYLEGVESADGLRFAFTNALAERLLVRTEQLTGRLASETRGDHAEAMQEYALLKRSFGALHRYDQEDWAFYGFKVNQRRCCPRSWWRPWGKLAQFCDWLLLDHGCGYCTNPYRAVRTALVIMLFFGVIYTLGIDYLNLSEHRPFPGDKNGLANRVTVGLFTSVSVFTSGLSGIRDVAKSWMNVPLIIESLLGTLLWGLFIVAISRKVIR